jgi:hypothetical protein
VATCQRHCHLFFISFSRHKCPGSAASRAEVRKNTAAVRHLLFRLHPAPTQYVSRERLELALDSLNIFEGETQPRQVHEYRIRQVLRLVGCGHTNLWVSTPRKDRKKPPSFRVLPFYTYTDGQQIWTRSPLDSTQLQIPNGAQLRSINGEPLSPRVAYLSKYQISDGTGNAIGLHTLNKNLLFNFLYRKYYPVDTAMQVEWQNVDGSIQSARMKAISVQKALLVSLKDPSPKEKPLFKATNRSFYYVEGRPDVAVLRIESFERRKPRMYKKVFSELEKRKTPYLVIDLRDNLGGNYADCINLCRYVTEEPFQVRLTRRTFRTLRYQRLGHYVGRLSSIIRTDILSLTPRIYGPRKARYFLRYKPRKRNRYDGQVFVLVNGWSASASGVLASFAKEKGNAICIGQETGGGAQALNGMQIPTFRLPAGRLRISVPLYHLDMRLGQDKGRGVVPQHPVVYDIEDILAGRDIEMEKVLELAR